MAISFGGRLWGEDFFKVDLKALVYFRHSSPEPQLQARKAARKSRERAISLSLM